MLTLVINLEHRPDRLARMLQTLKALDDVHIIRAVDGRLLPAGTSGVRTRGEVACFLSHVAALRYFVSHTGSDTALILEDDAVVPARGFAALCASLAQELVATGGSALCLGTNYLSPTARRKTPHGWTRGNDDVYGAHAILYTRQGAHTLLARYKQQQYQPQYHQPWDVWIGRALEEDLLIARPPLVTVFQISDTDTQRIT